MPKSPSQRRYTIRKYMGDDTLSWAVFLKAGGPPILTGLSQHEARYYRDQMEATAK